MKSSIFTREATQKLVNEEVSQLLVENLPWKSNLLIEKAEEFIPSSKRENMIKEWVKHHILLKSQSSEEMYEWMERSNAPQPLQRLTWSESPGIDASETFEARLASFLNTVSDNTSHQ